VKGYTPASGITYHSSGMVKDVKHLAADGVNTGAIWTQAIGVDAMARPSEISVTGHCPAGTLSASLTAKEITKGEPAALTVAAIGAQTFQWYERTASGDVLLAGQTTNTLGLTLDTSRSFWVRVGNAAATCTFDSNVVLVTVKAVQCPPISVTIDAPATVTPGATATASVQAGFTSYAWSVSGAGSSIVSGANSNQVTFKAGCSGPVTLQVIVSSSCATSPPTTEDVPVNGGATATVSGTTTVNQGPGTVDVTVVLTGTAPWKLVWSDGAQQTANVSPHKRAVPKDETRMYSLTSVVDGNGCTGTKSGSATITVKPPAPTQASAAAVSAASIRVTWSHSGSTDSVENFQLERRGPDGTNFFNAPASVRELTQTVAADAAYVYRVRAIKASTFSDFSSADLATTVIFVDDPLVPQVTKVRAVHLTQLRTAVAAVRALTTSTTPVFTDATPALVRRVHIEELRTMLKQARAALALPLWTFTDDPFAADQKIKAVHFDELRGGVR
jgi:hypothetical protein